MILPSPYHQEKKQCARLFHLVNSERLLFFDFSHPFKCISHPFKYFSHPFKYFSHPFKYCVQIQIFLSNWRFLEFINLTLDKKEFLKKIFTLFFVNLFKDTHFFNVEYDQKFFICSHAPFFLDVQNESKPQLTSR